MLYQAALVAVVPAILASSSAAQLPRSAPTGGAPRGGAATGEPGTVIATVKVDASDLPSLQLAVEGDGFGSSVAALGDLDGDGVGDVAVGAPFFDAFNNGAVYVAFLKADGSVKAATKILSTTGDGKFGAAIAALGDRNGDGTCDLAVTEPDWGGGGIGGAYWILFLEVDGTVKTQHLTTATSFPGAVGPLEGFTESIASIGDVDGDGLGDVAIGSPLGDFGSPNHGDIWIAFLDAQAQTTAAVKIGVGLGGLTAPLSPSGRFGTSIAGLGDVDADVCSTSRWERRGIRRRAASGSCS